MNGRWCPEIIKWLIYFISRMLQLRLRLNLRWLSKTTLLHTVHCDSQILSLWGRWKHPITKKVHSSNTNSSMHTCIQTHWRWILFGWWIHLDYFQYMFWWFFFFVFNHFLLWGDAGVQHCHGGTPMSVCQGPGVLNQLAWHKQSCLRRGGDWGRRKVIFAFVLLVFDGLNDC